ncbi:MAG: dihydrofolate reductase [Spirochaetales bacterium]|jgi:dihydrofolate reductase|nr:dihydrofolate reductase [Spirochaetales bacterium]
MAEQKPLPKPAVCLIAALTPGGVIGRGGGIPWKIPEDQRLFKKITAGHAVIMGRRTFQSLGRPLPERRNLVISRTLPPDSREVEVYPDLASGLAAAAKERPGISGERVFIIGGGGIYAQALPLASFLYLSRLRREYPGDVYFPPIPAGEWEKIICRAYQEFEWEVYKRNGIKNINLEHELLSAQ